MQISIKNILHTSQDFAMFDSVIEHDETSEFEPSYLITYSWISLDELELKIEPNGIKNKDIAK